MPISVAYTAHVPLRGRSALDDGFPLVKPDILFITLASPYGK